MTQTAKTTRGVYCIKRGWVMVGQLGSQVLCSKYTNNWAHSILWEYEYASSTDFTYRKYFQIGTTLSLKWRHKERDDFSNHQPHHCLLNRLFTCWSTKASKLRVTGLCEGNSPMTGEFQAQRVSNAENVSIWWRHHDGDGLGLSRKCHEGLPFFGGSAPTYPWWRHQIET